jgi:opine dehydrogenase
MTQPALEPQTIHFQTGSKLFSALYGRDLALDNDLLSAIGLDDLGRDDLLAVARGGWA